MINNQNLPPNSINYLSTSVLVPNNTNLDIRVRYVEACGPCNNYLECSFYTRTVYEAMEEFFIPDGITTDFIYPRMYYKHSLCSDYEDCTFYTAIPAK